MSLHLKTKSASLHPSLIFFKNDVLNVKCQKVHLALHISLPWVTKTEFLLTITNNIKQTIDENKEKYQLGDYLGLFNTKFSQITL